MRFFIQSEAQQQRGYPFLRNLAEHMVYSSQMGVKISICEFLKDLLGQDLQQLGSGMGDGNITRKGEL